MCGIVSRQSNPYARVICGTGVLLGAVFLFARLPFVLLLVPVVVLFIGLTAEPYHTHAIWYGMMNTLGIFRMDRLVPEDLAVYTWQPHYFWLGEVGMAAVLAGVFAVPAGIYLTGRTGIALAFILAMIVFVPLFRLPAETDPAGDAGGCSGGG